MSNKTYQSADGVRFVLIPEKEVHIESAHPGMSLLLSEALAKTTIGPNPSPHLELEVDMGRFIGKVQILKVLRGEEVIFVARKGRDNLSPAVKRPLEDCSNLVIIADCIENSTDYSITTAWCGYLSHPELFMPMSEERYAQAELYWRGDGKTSFGRAFSTQDPTVCEPILKLTWDQALAIALHYNPLLRERNQQIRDLKAKVAELEAKVKDLDVKLAQHYEPDHIDYMIMESVAAEPFRR